MECVSTAFLVWSGIAAMHGRQSASALCALSVGLRVMLHVPRHCPLVAQHQVKQTIT